MVVKIDVKKLLLYIAIAELAGGLGVLLSGGIKEVYGAINQPPLAPPSWVFGVVWPLLYLFIGIAAYMINNKTPDSKDKTLVNISFYISLLLNIVWTVVFFRFLLFKAAVFVLIAIIVFAIAMFCYFKKINPKAAYLIIPYILWLLFALYLNIGIAMLN